MANSDEIRPRHKKQHQVLRVPQGLWASHGQLYTTEKRDRILNTTRIPPAFHISREPSPESGPKSGCDAPKPGGLLTSRQPAEYKWRSGYSTPLQKIGQSLLCTGSSIQIQTCIYLSQTVQYIQYMSNTATWAHKQYSMYIPTMKPTIYPIVTRVDIFTLKQYIY